ncbi:MAG: DUF1949 domain-containing protein [Oscillospiraceae bacterium]
MDRGPLHLSYPLLERVKLEVQAVGGTVDAVDYGAEVALTLSLPEDAPGGCRTG